jgi:twitching motility protein PilJ
MSTLSSDLIKRSRKPVWVSIAFLLLFIVLMVGSFSYSYSQTALDNKRITLIADLNLLSQQLSTTTLKAVKNGNDSFSELERQKRAFKDKFKRLRQLNDDSSMAKTDVLDGLRLSWVSYEENLEYILKFKSAINDTHTYAETVYVTLPKIQRTAEQVVLRMEKEKSETKQLNMAISQLILLQKLQNNLLLMLEGKNDVKNLIQGFVKNIMSFDEKLKDLLGGNREKKLNAVDNNAIRFYLLDMEKQFNGLSEQISELLDNATLMQTVSDAVESGIGLGETLFSQTQLLKNKVDNRAIVIGNVSIAGYAFSIFAFISLLGLMYALLYDHRQRLRFTEEENESNQEAIMHLMSRMTSLSQGDLTVAAKVSSGVTGSIADVFNYTIESLRGLVTQINGTSEQLNAYAQQANQTAENLLAASQEQSDEVTDASVAINTITENIKRVADYTVNSAHVAKKSLEISRQGADTVRETLEGMHAIREQVQVTAKRIKRLSESSQEVSHISQLMNDIAEQTQVLALNASIQMTSVGDAGKGFGGVAEEVQMLAKKAAATSRKADVLVRTMQSDTQETVTSMEETITHVVQGTTAAENAGKALEEVESESARIAKLMANIAKVTKDQQDLASRSKDKMLSIQELNLQAFERVNETTEMINNLTNSSNELQVSVYRFKLPTPDVMSIDVEKENSKNDNVVLHDHDKFDLHKEEKAVTSV